MESVLANNGGGSNMVERGSNLVLVTLLIGLLSFGCAESTGTDNADAGADGDGGVTLNLAEAILGDWELFYSDSHLFSGTTGERLTYFLFVDEENLCVAVCNPMPDPLISDCESSEYDCECNGYTLDGDGSVCSVNGCTFAVTFQENGQVFEGVGKTAVSDVINRYRKTDTLPAAVEACKEQAGR